MPEPEGQGQETGTVQPQQTETVQPVETPEPQGQPDQGFLAEYLKDVPEEQRPVVQPILEKYRQDQDRNFNQRFEQVREEAKIPTTIYNALLQDPVQTIHWIADRIQEEQGVDVRADLLQRWGQGQQVQSPETPPENLTVEEQVERAIQAREEQRIQSEKQQQAQIQAQQQQAQTVNSWVDNAAKSFNLELNDENGEDPLRAVIIMQANQLHESGVAKGQAAVEMAVETVAQRFGGTTPPNGGQQPRVAEGGSPPPAQKIDVGDEKQRRARMLETFTGSPNQ